MGHDRVIHHPPLVLMGLGGIGFISGILTNFWQFITTFIALWALFNVGEHNFNWQAFWQRQPAIAGACLLIAFGSQLFLQFLVFRLDSAWKTQHSQGKSNGGAFVGATVQIIQQTDLVTVLSFIALIVDTVGDFTFISLYTSSIFLILLYAIWLYGLSTLGFVRSIEYLWAGFRAIYGR